MRLEVKANVLFDSKSFHPSLQRRESFRAVLFKVERLNMTSQLPQPFLNSMKAFAAYPENLVHWTDYLGASKAENLRLDDL